jgi:DNA-binding response OmpR family regulator
MTYETVNAGEVATVLVVDDTPANLHLLGSLLKEFGHSARFATSGELALQAARLHPPDLILLDVRLPKMSGYEICREFKADARLAEIPVIFVSALGDPEEKLQAFQAGGVDYVTKPFQAEEIRARIEVHLRLHRLQQEVEEHNARLEEAVRRRTKEVEEANVRLAAQDRAKNQFLSAVAHELRSPLNSLSGAAELAFNLSARQPEMAEYRQLFERSRERLQRLLDDALLLSAIQSRDPLPRPATTYLLDDLLRAAGTGLLGGAETLRGDPRLTLEALVRLQQMVGRFAPGREIPELRCQLELGQAVLAWQWAWDGTAGADRLRALSTLLDQGHLAGDAELGLSPAVAAQIIRSQGGTVRVTGPEAGMAGLQFTLPLVQKTTAGL